MSPNGLTISWMLWFCVGFLIRYGYHVKEARDDLARKERERALDKLLADVAIRCREIPTDLSVN